MGLPSQRTALFIRQDLSRGKRKVNKIPDRNTIKWSLPATPVNNRYPPIINHIAGVRFCWGKLCIDRFDSIIKW